jgi:dihydropyrimidinase
LVIWDEKDVVIRNDALHHDVDYTPYEGMALRAWPGLTLCRGRVVWDGETPAATDGWGRFLPCTPPAPGRPAQRHVTDFHPT